MGELTGGTVPAKIWRDIMLVATKPYGNSDFEYPEVVLNPFKASSVSIIPQSEAKKVWEEKEAAEREAAEKEAAAQSAAPQPPVVKPDAVKPSALLPQAFKPVQKKEPVEPKTIEVKDEPPAPDLAPVPVGAAPVGQ